MVRTHNFFKKRIYSVFFIVCAGISTLCAMQSLRSGRRDSTSTDDLFQSLYRMPRMGKTLERINVLKQLPELINDADNRISALRTSLSDGSLPNDKKADLQNQLNGWQDNRRALYELLKKDDKYGRAIARGLAGDDWKALEDERIANVWEGVQLGALMRVSRACSDVLSKRIENTIDRVVGGSWDFFIGRLVRGFEIINEGLLHSGQSPFDVKTLKGWQDLVKTSFDDIERLLKDGFKDSLRGHDMSLRDAEQEVDNEGGAIEGDSVLNAWMILINGYVRQFDYVVSRIDKHLDYYDEDDVAAFYAKEIKQRLLEVIKLLTQGKSLKEFDSFLDSNKSLIMALRKNIYNLFNRLIELVDENKSASPLSNSFSSSNRGGMRMGRDEGRGGLGSDDDAFPGSFRGL